MHKDFDEPLCNSYVHNQLGKYAHSTLFKLISKNNSNNNSIDNKRDNKHSSTLQLFATLVSLYCK